MATTLGQAYVQIIPSAQGITGKIQEVLSPEADRAGQIAGENIGGKIAAFATKAIAALGVGKAISDSITNGMNFETSMAKASTLFAGTADEFRSLQTEILGLSSSYGVAASEFAEAAYSAESASVPMGNLGGMLEGSAKLAVSGFTDIDTALSATAKTMNAYGMMSDDVAKTNEYMEKVQRVLIQTQNKGITTVDELGRSLAQVTPTAAAFNVSFEQVGAALAGMTAQGTPTAQATTQLNSLIAELGKNGTIAANNLSKAAEGTEYAGMSFNEMMQSGATLNDVLDMMQGLADENNVAMVDMFSSIEAGKAAMSISNSDFVGNLEAMATEADVVGDAFGKMSDTAEFKMGKLKESLKNVGIKAFAASADTMGAVLDGVGRVLDGVMPAVEKLGGALKDMGGAIMDAVREMLGLDESFSATDAIVSVLTTAIDGVTKVIGFLTDHMDIIVPVVTGAVTAFVALKAAMAITSVISGVGSAIGLLTNPIGLAVAAIAGIVAAGVALYKNWDTIKEKAGELGEKISEKWNNLKTAASESWESLKTTASEKFEAIGETISGALETARGYAEEKLSNIKTAFEEHGGGLEGTVAAAMEGVKTYYGIGFDAVNTLTGGKLGEVKAQVDEKFEGIKEKVSESVENVRSNVSEKFEAAKTAVATTVLNAYTEVQEKFSNMLNTVIEKATNIYTTARTKFDEAKIAIRNAVENAKTEVMNKFHEMLNTVIEKAQAIYDTAQTKFDEAKTAITEAVTNAKDEVFGKFSEMLTTVTDKAGEIYTTAKTNFDSMVTDVTTAMGTMWTNISTALGDIVTGFTTTFTDLASSAFSWGADIIGGIVDGINSMIDTVAQAASGVANTIRGFLHFSEPDVGPLSDFHTYMPDMIDLMAKGINDGVPIIKKAMDGLAVEILPEVRMGQISPSAHEGRVSGEHGFTQNITVNAPTELSASEVARQVRVSSQQTALRLRMA